MRKMGGEGGVAKRPNSRHEAGRRTVVVEVPAHVGQELMIGGFTHGSHRVEALVVGFYSDSSLLYAARVGADMVPATRRMLYERLTPRLPGFVRPRICPNR